MKIELILLVLLETFHEVVEKAKTAFMDKVSGMHIVELQRKLMEVRNEVHHQSKYRFRTAVVEKEKKRMQSNYWS